jgi:hypothetical protein
VKPLAFFLFAAAPIYAGVNYYLTDNLHAIDPTKWITVGSLAPSAVGLAAFSANGGALISKVPVPDGTAEAEVLATLTLEHSGGVYTEYLQASPNSHTGPQGGGAYLAFEMQNPTFDSTGHCVANFLVFQSSSSGVVSLLSSFQHACRNGMTMRFAVHGTTALVWPDQAQPVEFSVQASIGSPGIGSYNAPAGNAISLVQLGAIARELPPAIDQRTIGVSTFRNRVDVQWKSAAVSATSAGLNSYFIYRDGDYLLRTANTNFSDEAVAPGAMHSYTIYVVDQHFNLSTGTSITVSTPAIASAK